MLSLFQSTPSARRATEYTELSKLGVEISIHALREEGDSISGMSVETLQISIHALREEGDC